MQPSRRPLFELWPALEPQLGFLALGDFPTPVEPLSALAREGAGLPGETWVKRDDLSSPVYGGNKVRTLEALFGQARREGRREVVSTGAYGSNHAVATVLHAPRVGLRAGVMLFPQPYSITAMENLRVSATRADDVTDLLHWSVLPYAMRRRARQGGRGQPAPFVMPPGGAIPRGCLGFVSAALELMLQVGRGELPPPEEIVIGVGSTCSTAGLLLGLRIAARMGLAPRGRGAVPGTPPLLCAVRVTPWPVTSAFRILSLSRRASRWLAELSQSPVFDVSRAELARGLVIDGSQIGAGYGRPTPEGLAAIERLAPFSALDTTYSAKSAAALLERQRRRPAVRVYWSTKSGAPLPPVSAEALERAPRRMLRWLAAGAARHA